jgi:iron complex outermembrane receptor protein
MLRSGSFSFATLCGLFAAVTGVEAQAPAVAGPGQIEEHLVVGSRTRAASAFDAAVPVDVLTSAQLEASGAVGAELGQALATLVPSFYFPRQSNSGTSDLVRAGQLRGLSPDQVLVLVNGRRRHTSAIVNTETKIGRGTTAVDFNAIPLNAVQRIEVLRDGAGALYGSDAIAGVVNVVLDETLGLATGVSYGTHITDLDPVGESVRDGETLIADAKYGWAAGDGFFKVGGTYRTRNSTNRAGFDQVPFFVAQTPANLALQGLRNYAEGDPNVDELSVWFNAAVPLEAAEFYTFGTLGERESDGGAAFYRYPDGSSNVRAIYDGGFRPQSRGEDRDLAATAGLRGNRGAWSFDGSASYARNRFAYGVQQSLNASLGPSSPTAFQAGTYEADLESSQF